MHLHEVEHEVDSKCKEWVEKLARSTRDAKKAGIENRMP